MLRCAQSPRSNVPPKYASARRLFARLASEIFLISLQPDFFNKLLDTEWVLNIDLYTNGKFLRFRGMDRPNRHHPAG